MQPPGTKLLTMSPMLHISPPFSCDSKDLLAHQRMLKRLNGRIAVVVAIVAAELWALQAALQAWSTGEPATMFLAFQLVGFLASLATLKATPRHRLALPKAAPLRPQAAAAEIG